MIVDKFNEELLNEILFSKKTNQFTKKLSKLIMEMIYNELGRNKYEVSIPKQYRPIVVSKAYDACNRHMFNFNQDKLNVNNVISYVNSIIRSSYAQWIMIYARKLGKTKIIKEEIN